VPAALMLRSFPLMTSQPSDALRGILKDCNNSVVAVAKALQEWNQKQGWLIIEELLSLGM
jgi:hypothetical protein